MDAQLIDILKENLTNQIQMLENFRDWYQSESARALHELSLDEVRNKMNDLDRASYELRTTTENQLKGLTESYQNMIQLVLSASSASRRVWT